MPTPLELQQLAIRRRNNFSGRTDKYLTSRTPTPAVVDAVVGELGFLDVTNGLYGELYRESAVERIARYRECLRFYEGKHWAVPVENGERKPVENFCKVIVNKSVDFFVAKGLSFGAVDGNEPLVEAIDHIWELNNKDALFRDLAQAASITGDAYVYVHIDTNDALGNPLPAGKYRIRLTSLNPAFTFPLFAEDDPTKIVGILFQYPTGKRMEGGRDLFRSVFITNKEVLTYDDMTLVKQEVNGLGRVPVVHIPNVSEFGRFWGQSDLEDVIPLNEEHNIMSQSMRKIIRYHAEPTTIIYGAKASKLEKGANKVWSGLPVDARVENLQLQGDIPAITTNKKDIEEAIYRISGVPKVAFQTDTAVSNTSGVAIQMMYQPLSERVEEKRTAFTPAIIAVNNLIMAYMKQVGFNYTELADYPEDLDVWPVYSTPLPHNEVEDLDSAQKKLTMGITSKAELFRTFNVGKNKKKLAVEIIADQMATLVFEHQKAVALKGEGPPCPPVAFISSIAINEELEDVAKKAWEGYNSEKEEDDANDPPAIEKQPKQE